MNSRLTVSLEAPAPDAAPGSLGWFASVAASLPLSLRPVPEAGELVAVCGATAGWPQRALTALDRGARGILVVDPTIDDVAGLRSRAAQLGVPVVLDGPWAYNSALPLVKKEFQQLGRAGRLLEVRATLPVGASLDAALLAQLALVREAVGGVVEASLVASSERGYVVLGALASGLRVTISGASTDALPESARVRLLTVDRTIELAIPAPATARPARALIADASGATLLPTVYESAHRTAWRRLHAAVLRTGSVSEDDLGGFLEDAKTASALFAARQPSETSRGA